MAMEVSKDKPKKLPRTGASKSPASDQTKVDNRIKQLQAQENSAEKQALNRTRNYVYSRVYGSMKTFLKSQSIDLDALPHVMRRTMEGISNVQ